MSKRPLLRKVADFARIEAAGGTKTIRPHGQRWVAPCGPVTSFVTWTFAAMTTASAVPRPHSRDDTRLPGGLNLPGPLNRFDPAACVLLQRKSSLCRVARLTVTPTQHRAQVNERSHFSVCEPT